MKKQTIAILCGIIAFMGFVVASVYTAWPQETMYTFRMLPYALVIKTDARRVRGLQELKKEILDDARRTGTLPPSIHQLGFSSIANPTIIKDPVTKKAYAYRVLSEAEQLQIDQQYRPNFELCATFQGPSPIFEKDVTPACKGVCDLVAYFQRTNPFEPENTNFEFWDHEKGYTCWTFDATGRLISSENTTI